MKTLHNCFPDTFRNPPYQGIIGLEIETEVANVNDYPSGLLDKQNDDEGEPIWLIPSSKYWTGVFDGSLRNYGVEYILVEPLSFSDTMVALEEFNKLFRDVPFLKDQPGTSVHVHLNFLNQPLVKIANFIAAYTLVENLLTEFSGKTRRSNLFARPYRCADNQKSIGFKLFDMMVKGERSALLMSDSESKYAALNLATLGRLGTLEVRCFRGTTDTVAISEWVNILHELYLFSLKMDSPRMIFELFKTFEEDLISTIFPKTVSLLRCDSWRELIQRNEMYFAQYALRLDDWSLLDEKYTGREGPKRKAKAIMDDPAVFLQSLPESTQQPMVTMQEAQAWGALNTGIGTSYAIPDDFEQSESDNAFPE